MGREAWRATATIPQRRTKEPPRTPTAKTVRQLRPSFHLLHPSSSLPPAPSPPFPLLPTHENIYTLPNILTFSRLLAAPLVGYLLLKTHYTAALALFIYAGVTDLLDGWIARRWKMESVLGTIIDPMADKALMTVVTVGLAWGGSLPGM